MVDEKTSMAIYPRRITNWPIIGTFTLNVDTFVFYHRLDTLQFLT